MKKGKDIGNDFENNVITTTSVASTTTTAQSQQCEVENEFTTTSVPTSSSTTSSTTTPVAQSQQPPHRSDEFSKIMNEITALRDEMKFNRSETRDDLITVTKAFVLEITNIKTEIDELKPALAIDMAIETPIQRNNNRKRLLSNDIVSNTKKIRMEELSEEELPE